MTAERKTDDIVISGISCRLPESDNIEEFWENLISGRDMVTEDHKRWPPGFDGLPKKNGMLKDISKFDAGFFGIPPKQVNAMDPQLRILLEVTYEAIVDSGFDPSSIRGQKIGVIVGASHSEAHELLTNDPANITGYEMTGCNRAMLANRISYFFDLKGPSYTVDTACSSGLQGLCNAVSAIREGRCDAALVGAVNLLLKPQASLQCNALKMLSPEGWCKSFDESANGYCRSEGVVTVFLQKLSNSKRTYLRVVDILDNCDGYKEQGITYPSGEIQKTLLQEVYSKADIDPSLVTYVEAHCTGTTVGDPQEVNTIVDVFCKDRKDPLLLGSVKSNMGHSETTSGLAGIAKVLLSMKHSKIPRNLHFVTPNPNIPGLLDGRLEVVTETTNWKPGLAGINSFGFGGANVHAIVSPCGPERAAKQDTSKRLLVASARTDKAAEKIIASVQLSPADIELHYIINQALNHPSKTHPFRCFTVLNSDKHSSEIKKCEGDRPVWFIFPGMGCQWSGMGRDMLDMHAFRNAIHRCHEALDPLGFNLKLCLAECSEKDFAEDPMKAFIGICSIQIGLVDVLRTVGVKPDGIIGHSVGELACSYADGALTAEQTILAAYWRGRIISEAKLPLGAMAALGLTWEEVNMSCPKGLVAACHNARDSVTISGPKDLVEHFVAKLQADGKFARMVNSCRIAFHSPYMQKCASALGDVLKKVIPDAVLRSPRWISTSIPQSKWQTPLAQTASAEYHVNNLVSPVLFHEALKHIPPQATVIEVGPHGLFQAILRRSCSPDVTVLSLMKKHESDNVSFCLTNIGRCYLSGVDVNPMALCTEVPFPVSRDTPMLSPLVGWDHQHTWDVPNMTTAGDASSGQRVTIDLDKETYLQDHCINSRVLYPGGGFIALAWQSFAKAHGKEINDTPVTMFDFRLHNVSILPDTGKVVYTVRTSTGNGEVEILENSVILATCRIQSGCLHKPARQPDMTANGNLTLSTEDIYKELRIRGCDFGSHFQSVMTADISGRSGVVRWMGKVALYLDSLIQACILPSNDREVRLPTSMRVIEIDPKYIPFDANKAEVDFEYDEATDTIQAAGLMMTGVSFTSTPRKLPHSSPLMEEYCFVTHNETTGPVADNVLRYYAICESVASSIHKRIDCSKYDAALTQIKQKSDRTEKKNVSTESKVQSFPDNYDVEIPKHSFLKYLCSISTYSDMLYQLENSCDEDLIFNRCVNAAHLKSTLDMTVEIIARQKVRLLYCTTSEIFVSHVMNHIISQFNDNPNITFELFVTSPVKGIMKQLENLKKAIILPWREAMESALNGSVHIVLLSVGCGCEVSKDVMQQLLTLTSNLHCDSSCIMHSCELNNFLVRSLYGREAQNTSNAVLSEILQQSKLVTLADKTDGILSHLVLCRPKSNLQKYRVVYVDNTDFEWIEDAQNQLREIKKDNSSVLWFVAKRQGFSGIVGFVKCLLQESPRNRIRCLCSLDLQIQDAFGSFLPGGEDFPAIAEKGMVMNIYQNGVWGSFRKKTIFESDAIRRCDKAYLDHPRHGDLASLQWVQMPEQDIPLEYERINTYFSSLNFRDLMLATGRLDSNAVAHKSEERIHLGLEASGLNDKGQRKMGIASQGLACTECILPSEYTWHVPSKWSLREAASVPMAYATAYYALVLRAGMRRGDTVLIHSATSSVGQAALRIAKYFDCTIYATVGTAKKTEYLQKQHGLQKSRIASSRNTDFVHTFLRATSGRGMDIILNSLADEKLQVSLDLVGREGHFLEIGKYDLSRNSKLGMAVFLRNITFHGIVLENLLQPGHREWEAVWNLVDKGINDGVVVPLATYVYSMDDVEKAFRLMGEGKHIGKILIQVRKEEPSKETCNSGIELDQSVQFLPNQLSIPAFSRTYFEKEKTYIITGGLGGLGLELANWMVERGAMKLILTSRSGVKTGYQKKMLACWKNRGVRVCVSHRNVVNFEEASQLITEGQVLGPIGGVFHLAAVLRDGFLESQTIQTFREVVNVKVQGCTNLDVLARRECSETLDWFVVFSSAVVCYGNAGQTNYGFANSVMERVCEKRHLDGLPGKALQWGFIGDVGIVQKDLGGNNLVHMGSVPQRIQSFLEVLDYFLQRPEVVLSSVVSRDAAFANSETFDNATYEDEIVQSVLRIVGMRNACDFGPDVPLSDLGLDSLMVTEIRQVLGRKFNIQTSVTDIYQMTIKSLKSLAS